MAERPWIWDRPLRVPQWSVLVCVGVKEREKPYAQSVLRGCVQSGPGPGNTEIKKTKAQLLRTSQSDGGGRQVTQMTNNRVRGAGWSPEQDRAWVGQETSELTSEVSQVDGGVRHSRQKEQVEEMGCSSVTVTCPPFSETEFPLSLPLPWLGLSDPLPGRTFPLVLVFHFLSLLYTSNTSFLSGL